MSEQLDLPVTAERLQKLHLAVWSWRHLMEDVSDWVTPPPQDAIEFAVTEAAEALDARLRLNPLYARNNHKDERVEAELADCVIMLITALGEEHYYRPDHYALRVPEDAKDLIWIVKWSAQAAFELLMGWTAVAAGTMMATMALIMQNMPLLESEVALRMDRLYNNHKKREGTAHVGNHPGSHAGVDHVL